MLSKILYSGFEANDFSLEIIKKSDGGRFKTELNHIGFIFYEIKDSDDNNFNMCEINVKAKLSAYSDEEGSDENLAFVINADFNVIFTILDKKTKKLSEEFINDNNWFFQNYIRLSMKLLFEQLSKNTPLDGITLPWSRPIK